MRGAEFFAPGEAGIAVSHIIGQDEDDVGSSRRGRKNNRSEESRECQGHDSADTCIQGEMRSNGMENG